MLKTYAVTEYKPIAHNNESPVPVILRIFDLSAPSVIAFEIDAGIRCDVFVPQHFSPPAASGNYLLRGDHNSSLSKIVSVSSSTPVTLSHLEYYNYFDTSPLLYPEMIFDRPTEIGAPDWLLGGKTGLSAKLTSSIGKTDEVIPLYGMDRLGTAIGIGPHAKQVWRNAKWIDLNKLISPKSAQPTEITTKKITPSGMILISETGASGQVGNSALLPVEVSAVFERDQVANRIPNPKRPGYHAIGSSGNLEETKRTLYNRLFIAVEPESDKVEATVKHMKIQQPLAGEFSIVITDDAGSIIKSTPINPAGETDIDFVVTGTMGSTISYVDIARSSGPGGDPELLLKSHEKIDGLSIQVAKSESISASLNALAITIALVNNGTAGEFYRTYLGTLAHPTGAVSQGPKVRIIGQTPPTMIAGSTYDQTTWNTEVRSFRLPDGSKSSDLLENYFSNGAGYGLHGVCRDLMSRNSGQIWNDFTTAGITSKVYNFPIIPETAVNFYFQGVNNPKYAWGSANYLNGTVTLKLKKSGTKVIAEEVKMMAEIEDYYDFDFTRPQGSFSNHAAIVQIGNEGTLRPKGKVFHTVTEINFSYDESTGNLINGGPPISFFNANGYIENGTFITTGGGGGGGNE